MINLKNIHKRFNTNDVLNGINLKFDKNGFYAICGPSGCGKTTLLNIISSLSDFEGSIKFGESKYENLSEKELDNLRNNNIGFIFQDYKLFEFDTVKSNLSLALEIKSGDCKKIKDKRIHDLLNLVGLSGKENELVCHLSGGEKQRVAIARAISNSPKIILADEPTGNLDKENGLVTMELLQKISQNSLVIMVTHDRELAKKYVNKIINMKDGKIISIEENIALYSKDRLSIIKLSPETIKSKLPLKFCFGHSINSIKRRKWRTALIILMTSFGLIGVGLGALITDIISTNLYNSYSSLIDDDKIVMTPKSINSKKKTVYSATNEDVKLLKNNFSSEIKHDGVYYQNNFLNFFDYYSFSLDLPDNGKVLPTFTPAFFNEYENINECHESILCYEKDTLNNDEVILSLTPGLLNEICFQLHIVRTVESFAEYLKSNNVIINVYLENGNWNYYKEFSIFVVGFFVSNKDCFIHSSNTWNQYIFENLCGLPTTDIISSNTSHPWDLKKVPYVCCNSIETILKEIKLNRKYSNIVGEILTDESLPTLYRNSENEFNRIALYSVDEKDIIPLPITEYIKTISPHIKSCVPGSGGSYAMYPDNLMMGFAKQTFVSTDSNYLENVIDIASYIKSSDDNIVNIPENVVMGYFAKSDGLRFSSDYSLMSGIKPRNYSEIVISKALANKLKFTNPINRSLYLCFPKTEDYLSNGYIKRNFVMTDLKIVGVSDSNKLEVNSDENWPIIFFQTQLKISSFDLSVNALSLTIEKEYVEEVIPMLERAFPSYNSTSPVSGVKSSVDSICGTIEQILTILSISSLLISTILLSICNYIHFVEIKKDIGLSRCLGVSKSESKKLMYSHSILMSMLSFVVSVIELLIISFFMTKSFAATFGTDAVFVFNPMCILYMFLVCVGISVISCIFISLKVNKYDALECLNG